MYWWNECKCLYFFGIIDICSMIVKFLWWVVDDKLELFFFMSIIEYEIFDWINLICLVVRKFGVVISIIFEE